MTIITSTISFIDRHHNQSSFCSFNVFNWAILDFVATKKMCFKKSIRKNKNSHHIPSLLLWMVIPGNMLVFKYVRNFNKTSQMNTLSVSNNDFLFKYAWVADIICFISNILSDRIQLMFKDLIDFIFNSLATIPIRMVYKCCCPDPIHSMDP